MLRVNNKTVLIIFLASIAMIGLIIFAVPDTKTEAVETSTTERATTERATTEAVTPNECAYLGEFTIYGYCGCEKCCGRWGANRQGEVIGASGQPLTDGCVSVDPSLIPYGTELEIDGKTYTAADLGRSDAIGIYFETHQEAEDFGTKTEDVYLTHGTGVFGTCGNQ